MTDFCELPTITIPTSTGQPGATGSSGSNGGVVLHNDATESSVLTVNSWQNLSTDKTYTVALSLLSVGDRLKIDVTGSATHNFSNTSLGARILFDSNPVTTAGASMPGKYIGYFKFSTILDVIGTTSSALNIKAYTRYEYCFHDPFISMVGADFNMEEKYVTVDYATTPAKKIEIQGIINGTIIDAVNYVKINQLCVEYFKKI